MGVDGGDAVTSGHGFHDELSKAAFLASSSNSPMPLLKLELKSKILARRHSIGQANIDVQFTPKPPQPLRKDEIIKNENRKASNRRSAAKSRVKEKYQRIRITKLYAEVAKRNEELRKQCDHLIAAKQQLMRECSNIGCNTDNAMSSISKPLTAEVLGPYAIFGRSQSSPAPATYISSPNGVCFVPPFAASTQVDISRTVSPIRNLPTTVASMDLSDFEGVPTCAATGVGTKAADAMIGKNDSLTDNSGICKPRLDTDHCQSESGGCSEGAVEIPDDWDGLSGSSGDMSPLVDVDFDNGCMNDSTCSPIFHCLSSVSNSYV